MQAEHQDNPYHLSAEVLQAAQALRRRLDAARRAPLPPDDALPPVPARHLERIEAFETRALGRGEQGRTA